MSLCTLTFAVCCLLSLPQAQETPFNRGVNLSNGFQANGARQVQLNKYTLTDFARIKILGCDVIRLPINLHAMTSGAPDHQVDPLLFVLLDSVVSWAEATDLHLILDNHFFDPAVSTSPAIGSTLRPV